jgi:hypothetical protein
MTKGRTDPNRKSRLALGPESGNLPPTHFCMKPHGFAWLLLVAFTGISCSSLKEEQRVSEPPTARPTRQTENLILVTLDGLRWHEVFTGADPNLFNPEHGGVKEAEALRADFWRDTAEARREALLPFPSGRSWPRKGSSMATSFARALCA